MEKSYHTTSDLATEEQYQLLLVDQNPAQIEIIRKMLRFHGGEFVVDATLEVNEAIHKVTRGNYDLIVLSSHLPDFDGLKLLDFLCDKQIPSPVLLLIDESAESLVQQARRLGVTEFLIRHRGYLTALPVIIRNLLSRQRLGISPRRMHSAYAESGSSSVISDEQNPASLDDEQSAATCGFILDRRGRFLSAETEVLRLTAYSTDELLELTIMDLIPNEREWDFYDWIQSVERELTAADHPFVTAMQGKYGKTSPIELRLQPVRDRSGKIAAYSGELSPQRQESEVKPQRNGQIDQIKWVEEMLAAMPESYGLPANKFMERLAELTCRTFKFRRATLALLDRSKRSYIKHVMIGYLGERAADRRNSEVPEEVIERIFSGRFHIKVIYYSQDYPQSEGTLSPVISERRTQRRRPTGRWHPRDLVLINLCNSGTRSFGYISLDDPVEGHAPTPETFRNLEIFSRLASTLIQNYFHFVTLERRTRRLKQVLVTSNIFKLYLSLNELLREIVWAVKFSLEFNVVGLALISQRSGLLEMKAVACEDKIKTLQLLDLKFDLTAFAALLRREYARGKSFLITRAEPVLQSWKQICFGTVSQKPREQEWPRTALLLVPLKSRENKIIGFLLVDDPVDTMRPNAETLHTLETLANQISVAIENRMLYLDAKRRSRSFWPVESPAPPQRPPDQTPENDKNETISRGVKRLFEKLWR